MNTAMDIYKTERALDKRERKNQVRLDTWTGVREMCDVEEKSTQDEQEPSVPEVQELS